VTPPPRSAAAEDERAANLLGALALVVTDRTVDSVSSAAGQSETAAVALSALHHFLDRPTVDRLRQVLGLTSSGTVRLVDRLEGAGYVRRRAATDGRATVVTLTASGRRAAERVAKARTNVLGDALSTLSATERATFTDLVSRVLAGLVRDPDPTATRWLCRLCDTGACGRDDGRCPVHNEVQARLADM